SVDLAAAFSALRGLTKAERESCVTHSEKESLAPSGIEAAGPAGPIFIMFIVFIVVAYIPGAGVPCHQRSVRIMKTLACACACLDAANTGIEETIRQPQ
ncbi:MAG: hypothetical protein WCE52_07455, partial [Candidatus Acidiferrum sp.]